ncbi:hypothetical protein EIN_333300 [Entamoeba invadens IP1]|uniref:CCHC-type domain-containing protein n=1 Tax=Entamoeba invadens IP1 TaxID=370355 RepID=A0A0A1UG74_ENTIV|nr:hypothetical protein EIN_333300 [Entamoeba invadens IP1]ELP92413.1 hypothetical protein EIN_333300 [Entamoeba invadens IP1]|eukprot:XP_004259184.1 hypothetical protein EIN_333300 [Entamoeba invadens IP1]
MTKTNPITVQIQPIDSTMTDNAIHALFKKYSPISCDNPRYEKDTPLNFCKITMENEEAVNTLIKEKNETEWDGVKVIIYFDKTDPSRSTANFLYKTLDKSEDDVKKYLEKYEVKSVERLITKEGTLMHGYLSVVLKDLDSAIKMKENFKNNEKTKKYNFKFITKTGEHLKQCFICGKYGHEKNDCPEKGKQIPVIKTHNMKKAEKIFQKKQEKRVERENRRNFFKNEWRRQNQNTKE